MPLEVEEDYLLFSWSDSKWAHLVHCEEIFDSELELLTPLWQAVLGLHYSATVHAAWQRFMLLSDGSRCSAIVHVARQRFTLLDDGSQLLGNSSQWSDHEFDCSALFAPAWTSSRRRCTTSTRRSGTSCGGCDPGYPRQTTWAVPPGAAQPTRQSLAGHDSARRLPQDTGKIS